MMTFSRFAIALVAASLTATPLKAATTDWSQTTGARMRVITPGGEIAADGTRRIGLEIELQPGWKTYWRTPGDAGLPPYFDHSASVNIASLDIHWPVPHRFDDGEGQSIGYKGRVVLPITVKPDSNALPVILSLTVDYGVCREICVPATGTAKILLGSADAPDAASRALIAKYSAEVPGAPTPDLKVIGARPVDDRTTGKKALVVRARLADPNAKSDLFVEGPESWYFPAPQFDGIVKGIATWRVPLDAIPAKASLEQTPLTFTLVNGTRAVEQRLTPD